MRNIKICMIASILIPIANNACPTCVARIQKDSPAFFNEDFYTMTPTNDGIDNQIDSQAEDSE